MVCIRWFEKKKIQKKNKKKWNEIKQGWGHVMNIPKGQSSSCPESERNVKQKKFKLKKKNLIFVWLILNMCFEVFFLFDFAISRVQNRRFSVLSLAFWERACPFGCRRLARLNIFRGFFRFLA